MPPAPCLGLLLLGSAPFPHAGEISAALSALLWGSSGIVMARIRPPPTAGALNYGKNVSATLCFLAALWIVSGSPMPQGLDAQQFWIFCASGFLGLALCDTFLMRSLLDIGPQRMTLVFVSVPALTALVASLPPLSERADWPVWMGIAVCLGGITLAVRRQPASGVDPVRFKRGVRNAFIAALFQTAAILLARYGLSRADAPLLDSAVVRMTAGTVGVALLGLVGGRLGSWHRQLRRPRTAVMLFSAAFFGTFLGIFANQAGLLWSTNTGVATTLNSMMPIYLLPLSVIFLHERFGRREIVATLIAVAGVALMMLGS